MDFLNPVVEQIGVVGVVIAGAFLVVSAIRFIPWAVRNAPGILLVAILAAILAFATWSLIGAAKQYQEITARALRVSQQNSAASPIGAGGDFFSFN